MGLRSANVGIMTSIILEKMTAKGRLRIEPYDDPDFPGFTFYLNDLQIGVFEFDSVKDSVFLHVWTEETEEPVTTFKLDASESHASSEAPED